MRSLYLALLIALSCGPVQDANRTAPTDWSTEKGKERNFAWRAQLGGYCFTRPVVAGGLVWVGTNNEAPRDPQHKGDAVVLMCFRERDGQFVWQHVSARKPGMDKHGDWGTLPLRCTPLIEGERLWFINCSWEVICLDIGPLLQGKGDPQELWRTDLIEKTGSWPQTLGMGYGVALSICSYMDKIYLATGTGIEFKLNKITRPEAPALVCLDKKTGALVGRERSGISARTHYANWSSPVIATFPGRDRTLLIFGGGDGFLYAFDPVPVGGTLREVWKSDCRRRDGQSPSITASSVVDRERVYAALGDSADDSGPGNLSCIDLATGRRLWSTEDFGLSVSTPTVEEGRLLAIEGTGFVNCFDALTGKRIWQHDTLSMVSGSPLVVDGKAYLCTGDEELLILDLRSSGPKPLLAKREVPGCGMSTPAYVGGTLYIAGSRHLFAIREEKPGPSVPSVEAVKRGRAPDAIYLPTPRDLISEILALAAVKESDVLYDLGSGDGRIVGKAAIDTKCRSVGVEIDAALLKESRESLKRWKVDDRARIDHEDMLKVDFSEATVLYLYVGDRLNRLLLPKLQKLKPGSRIVTHRFALPGMKPDKKVMLASKDDQQEHEFMLYTTPLRAKD